LEYKRSKELINVTVTAEPVGKSTIKPWGNSLGIRIPADVLKMARLAEGVDIEFLVSDNDEIVLRPKRFPDADDQEGLRALYLLLASQVTPDMEGHEDEDNLWEPMGDEIF
jgi:antitoxin MazE